jgi:hypothetical protein
VHNAAYFRQFADMTTLATTYFCLTLRVSFTHEMRVAAKETREKAILEKGNQGISIQQTSLPSVH